MCCEYVENELLYLSLFCLVKFCVFVFFFATTFCGEIKPCKMIVMTAGNSFIAVRLWYADWYVGRLLSEGAVISVTV